MHLILTIGVDRVGKLTDDKGVVVGTVVNLSTAGEFESLRAVVEVDLPSPVVEAAKGKGGKPRE